MDAETLAKLDEWAFNVALECSALTDKEGQIALGGALLNLHDLHGILQATCRLLDGGLEKRVSALEKQMRAVIIQK